MSYVKNNDLMMLSMREKRVGFKNLIRLMKFNWFVLLVFDLWFTFIAFGVAASEWIIINMILSIISGLAIMLGNFMSYGRSRVGIYIGAFGTLLLSVSSTVHVLVLLFMFALYFPLIKRHEAFESIVGYPYFKELERSVHISREEELKLLAMGIEERDKPRNYEKIFEKSAREIAIEDYQKKMQQRQEAKNAFFDDADLKTLYDENGIPL